MTHNDTRQFMYIGALYGLMTAMIYAVGESFFLCVLSSVTDSGRNYMLMNLSFASLLLLSYAISGAIIGGLSGTITSTVARNIYPTIGKRIKLGLTFFIALSITIAVIYRQSGHTGAVAALFYLLIIVSGSYFFNRSPRHSASQDPVILRARTALKRTIPLIIVYYVLVVTGTSGYFPKQIYLDRDDTSEKARPVGNTPNIILITLDTTRADHFSVYGYERETTPNLKQLASKCTLYTQAFASGDLTLSSHASIFTGMYGSSHGAHHEVPDYPEGRPLDKNITTIAEVLRNHSYSTAAVVSNFGYLSSRFHLNKGFQYYDTRKGVPFVPLRGPKYSVRTIVAKALERMTTERSFRPNYRRADRVNDAVFSLLAKFRRNHDPFFLFVNYMDAHSPYLPVHPYDTLFPGKNDSYTHAKFNVAFQNIMQLKDDLGERMRQHIISQYDGEIAYLDFHLGKLLSRLKDAALYENSLIIITSDHGEAFGDRSLLVHGSSVYNDQIHIPLIVKYPNSREKKIVDGPVSSVDVMPTILDVAGLVIPDQVQGRSLLKLQEGKPRYIFSESFPQGYLVDWHPRFYRTERAIISGSKKLISSTNGKCELFELSNDIHELNNLQKLDGPTVEDMDQRLKQWVADVKTTSAPQPGFVLDEEMRDRLKSLGYIN